MNDPDKHKHGQDLKKFKNDKFLGKNIETELVIKIANGIIDPITYENFNSD